MRYKASARNIFFVGFLISAFSSFAQEKWFLADGTPITDTAKTIGDMMRFAGYSVLHIDLTSEAAYVPLTGRPVYGPGRSFAEVKQCFQKFNFDKYFYGVEPGLEFDEMKDHGYTLDSLVRYLGPPHDTDLTGNNWKVTYVSAKYCFDIEYNDLGVQKLKRYDVRALKNKLVINDYGIELDDDDLDLVRGCRFSFTNNSPKRIKYIYLTVRAENTVGDPVSTKIATGIGPIEPHSGGSYKFTQLFYSRIIEAVRLQSIKVQYFDGSAMIMNKDQIRKAHFSVD